MITGEDKYVQILLKDIGIEPDVKCITRIGEKQDGKYRPIKVVLKSSNQRNLLLKSLVNLKEKPHRGIKSQKIRNKITEDYTNRENHHQRVGQES